MTPAIIHRSRKATSVFLLFLVTAFLYADLTLMSPNLTAMASDFGFDHQQRDTKLGGQLSLAYFLLGAPGTLIVGLCTERFHRKRLLTVLTGFSQIANFGIGTGWIHSFNALWMTRALQGISLGGTFTVCFSMLGDMFAADKRNTVSGGIGLAFGLGNLWGSLVGGFLGDAYGWRTPFLVHSVLASAAIFTFALFADNPPRNDHKHDDEEGQQPLLSKLDSRALADLGDHWKVTHGLTIKKVFSISTNQLIFLQGIPGCVPWGVLSAFFIDYLAQEKHLGVPCATIYSSTLNLGLILGGVLGGWIGQRLYNTHGGKYVAYLMGSTTILAILPMFCLINADYSHTVTPLVTRTESEAEAAHLAPAVFAFSWQSFSLLTVALCFGLLASITGSNVRAVCLNVNEPRIRGVTLSIFACFDDLGKGLAPLIAATVIRWVNSRQRAFNIVLWAWVLCGLVLLAMSWTIENDEERVSSCTGGESTGAFRRKPAQD